MCRNNHGCHGNISPRRAYRLRDFLPPDAQMIYPTYTPLHTPTHPYTPYITYTPYKKNKRICINNTPPPIQRPPAVTE